MLSDYPFQLECHNFHITIPEPAAYVLQKLLASPTRSPVYKREKDINAVRELLVHIKQSTNDAERIKTILSELPPKAQRTIHGVCQANYIDLEQ
jgi:hypothetical protein